MKLATLLLAPPRAEPPVRWRTHHRWIALIAAITIATLAYYAIYSNSISASIHYIITGTPSHRPQPQPVDEALTDLHNTLLTVALALAVILVSLGRVPWTPDRRWSVALLSWASIVLAIALGSIIIGWILGDRINSTYTLDEPAETIVVKALNAGIGEEILVLAIPVLILRMIRCPNVIAIAALIALRVAYHLYYGAIGWLWLAPWALAAAACFWAWPTGRTLAGFIAIHVAFDIRGLTPGWTEAYLVLLGAILLGAGYVVAKRDPRPGSLRPAATPPVRRRVVRAKIFGDTIVTGVQRSSTKRTTRSDDARVTAD